MKKIAIVITLIMVAGILSADDIPITIAAGQQIVPAVATDGTDFFVTWEDARAGTGNPNIYGRVVSSEGELPGIESPVCAFAGLQKIPDIAWGGSFYLDVWYDRRTSYEIYGNFVNADGSLHLGNYRIVTVDGTIQNIRVSGADDNFLVVWEERIFGISNIFFIITKPDLSSTIPRQLGDPEGNDRNPAIARGDTMWVVVFEDSTDAGKGLYAQQISYGPAGIDTMGLYPITTATGSETYASIAFGGDGFLVLFERAGATTGRDIYGIRLDSSGMPVGLPFPICTEEGNQVRPTVSFDGLGYLVAWQDGRDFLSSIYGQRIGTTGTLIGPEIPICIADGAQLKPRSASNGAHHLIAWEDNRDVTTDIYATMLPALEISDGPEATIIQPLPGIVTSCNRYPVKMLITDDDGLDLWSLSFFNGRDTINAYSSGVVFEGDTFIYTPPWDWPSGETINLSLIEIADIFGNSMESPVNWSFTADLDPPNIDNLIPRHEQVLMEFPGVISANIIDDITGVDVSTIRMIFNGDTIFYPDPRLTWDGWTIRLRPDTTAFPTAGTHSVSVRAGDSPDVCDPNFASASWVFYVNPSGGPNASALSPRSGQVVARANPEVKLKILDPDGVDETTIEIRVGGVLYTWPHPAMEFDDSILTITPTDEFSHGDAVAVNLLHAMDTYGVDIDAPLNYTFHIDIEPPEILSFFPAVDGTLKVGTHDIWVVAHDEPAGVLVTPARVSFDFFDLDMALLESSSSGLTARVDTVVLQSGAFGASLGDGEQINICANIADNPDVYEPNEITHCWRVYVQRMSIAERELPKEVGIIISPNPFNAACRIEYPGAVEIFDVSGKLVAVFEDCTGGTVWDGTSRKGSPAPSGVYLIKAKDTNIISRAVLLR